jgi:hypothetical protein
MMNHILITATLFIVIAVQFIAAEDAYCTLSTPKGKINLNPLARKTFYPAASPEAEFYVNICTNAVKSCDGKDYAAVFFNHNAGGLCSGSLGTTSQTRLYLLNSVQPDAGIYLEYRGGQRVGTTVERRTRVRLICDISTKNTPVTSLSLNFVDIKIEADGFYYEFEMRTAIACPGFVKETSSKRRIVGFGGAVLIVAPILFILYMIIGSAILKFKYEKSGTEMIIHYQYLIQIPLLIWEGVLLTKEIITSQIIDRVRKPSSYSELN